MGVNYCRACGNSTRQPGFGSVPDSNRKWWQFWLRVPCNACSGSGYERPTKQGNSIPMSPPPPVKR